MDYLTVVKRTVFVAAVLVLAAASSTGLAQQAAGRGRGAGAGTAGPVNAYAYADCNAAAAPAIGLVIVTGAVPAVVPDKTPQPSVKLVLNTTLDALAAEKSIEFSPEAAKGGPTALALSCPVVGECVPARTGTLTIQRRADDGALWGNYQATWPGGQPRMGRFTAVWRESQKKCG